MKERKISVLLPFVRGTLFALVVTLVLVLVFALIVRMSGLSGITLNIISQIIKVVSIFVGVGICIRSFQKRGWLYGGIMGILYTAFAFFVFSIIGTNFDITVGFLYDMLFAIVVGVVSAMLLKIGRRAY